MQLPTTVDMWQLCAFYEEKFLTLANGKAGHYTFAMAKATNREDATMKKIFAAIATVAIAVICATPAITSTFDTYTSSGFVWGVIGQTVIVRDFDGNVWEFNGNGYHVGDAVRLTMGDAGTPEYIEDDTVERAAIIA